LACGGTAGIEGAIELCDYEVEWNARNPIFGLHIDGKEIDLPNYYPSYGTPPNYSNPPIYVNFKLDLERWLNDNNYQFSEINLDIDCNKIYCKAKLTVQQVNASFDVIESGDGSSKASKFSKTNCRTKDPIIAEIKAVIKSSGETSRKEEIKKGDEIDGNGRVTLYQVQLSGGETYILTEEEIIKLGKPLDILGCQVINDKMTVRLRGKEREIPLREFLSGDRQGNLFFDKTCIDPKIPTCNYDHFTEANSIVWNIFHVNQLPHYEYYSERSERDEDGLLEVEGTDPVNKSFTGVGEFVMDFNVRPDIVADREVVSTEFVFNYSYKAKGPAQVGLHDGNNFISVNGGQTKINLCPIYYECFNTFTLVPDVPLTTEQILNLKAVGFIAGALEIYANELNLTLTGPCDPVNCKRPTPVCSAEEARRQKEYIEDLRIRDATIEMLNMPMPNALHRVILCNGSELYLWEHELKLLYGAYEILQSIEVPDPTDFEFTVFQEGDDAADAFAMRLHYAGPIDAGFREVVKSQTGGNISSIDWQARGRQTQRYAFSYDGLDRLTKASYIDLQPNGSFGGDNKYGVPEVSYDLNGNIQTLARRGPIGSCDGAITYGVVDLLDYKKYNGNQLETLVDKAWVPFQEAGGVKAIESGYTYDDNGNLISDTGKGIAKIKYNFLNLPNRIDFGSGNSIEYVYDATGAKLRKIVTTEGVVTESRDYVGGVELVDNNLEAIYHSEGRMGANGMEYTITDHLGNARVSFADLNGDKKITVGGEQSEILQENHYYPFGLKMEGKWAPQIGKENKYGYNNKELSDEFGLNWNDYGARFYDPAIGKFISVDAIADHPNQIDKSPYAYGWNNPINLTDPDGNCPFCPIPFIVAELAVLAEAALVTTAVVGTVAVTAVVIDEVIDQVKDGPAFVPTDISNDTDTDTTDDTTDDDETITLYRGVGVDKPKMHEDAMVGTAIPLGLDRGHSDPIKHNLGDNNSIFTSWTTHEEVARTFASKAGPGGVIMTKEFKQSEIVPGPDYFYQGERLIPGVVTGARSKVVK